VERLEIFKRSRDENEGRGIHHLEINRNLPRLQSLLGGKLIKEGSRSLFVVEHRLNDDKLQGNAEFSDWRSTDVVFIKVLFPGYVDFPEGAFSIDRFLFIDIETNGLSGGAGTCAFLVGILEVKKNEVLITQYFLPDMSSERFFLTYLSEHLERSKVLVSYNGRCFDLNIIKNRFILNGMKVDTERFMHLDLLYTSRRIWKGLCPDFTLRSVEHSILDFNRKIDIPSYMIPQVYFDYLRGYDVTDELYRVFIHNREDVLSLLSLLLAQLSVVKGRIKKGESSACNYSRLFNPASLSRMMVKSSFIEEAIELLNTFNDDVEALKILVVLCKKQKKIVEAERVCKLIVERSSSVYDYIFACTELAKIYEHVKKDLEAALRFTEMAINRITRTFLLFPNERWRMEKEKLLLNNRLLRLKNRLVRKQWRNK